MYADNSIYDNLTIPTYIINLRERSDRRSHILEQFKGRTEFDVSVIDAIRHPIGAVGLWESILGIVRIAMQKDDDVIVICEDDHQFTDDYSRSYLFKNIIESYEEGTNILIGGVGGFQNVVPVTQDRWWVDSFWCTQFLIVYKKFFRLILEEPFNDDDTADGKFSEMTSCKMLLFPFISEQIDFGYSDVTKSNDQFSGSIIRHFEESKKRLAVIAQARSHFGEMPYH